VGTSVSFRSPNTPRWQALRGSLETSESLERIRSELFNAGESWSQEFADDAITPFVRGVVRAFDSLGEALTQAERPERALLPIVREARFAAIAAGAPASVAIAERALIQTLVMAMRRDAPLAETTSAEAAEAWRENRGLSAAALAQRYLTEVVRQFALHAVSRDAAAVFRRMEDAGALREFARSVGETAAAVADSATFDDYELRQSPARAWRNAVQTVFRAGRELPTQ
jgi:hypothetical protein